LHPPRFSSRKNELIASVSVTQHSDGACFVFPLMK
jgi:hypothetical protein